MQIDGVDVSQATTGQAVGVRVSEHARVGDGVFKLAE
jgi:hypothetical protein